MYERFSQPDKALERYAKARPVDPLPHRLLATLALSHAGSGGAAESAIPHLEYLDAREQNSGSYAAELANQLLLLNPDLVSQP